jgi:protease-4
MSTYNFNPPPPDDPNQPNFTPPAGPPVPPSSVPPQGPPVYQRPPQAAQKKSNTFTWVMIGGGVFVLFVLAVFTLTYFAVKGGETKSASGSFGSGFGDKIAVIDIQGVILEAKPTIEQIKKYEKDDSIKAIVLRIDSPGGGAAASQELYMYVKRIADKHNKDSKKKPIISTISTVGASGAYYIAAGTNKIYATDASIVGSIGVIAQWVNYGDLMKWAKLKDMTMKAGALKDAGNPSRDMTEPERAYLQGLIDNMHAQFIHDVATGRNMDEEAIKSIADGRVWTGQEAAPLKLIDELADYETAISETAKSVGINGEPTIVKPEKDKRTVYDLLFGDISDLLPDRAKMMSDHVGFYYLWR